MVDLQKERLFSIPVEEDKESINEQEVEEKIHNEGYQYLKEDYESYHDSIEDN
jgi:hypothetical protein